MTSLLSTFLQPFTSHKYLLYQLLLREIKARYKQSILGYAWVIVNPLVQMLLYTFVFSLVFKFPTAVPYPLYLLAALLPWTFLQAGIASSTTSLVDNSTLLKKVAFPREIIPYAAVSAKLIDFGFASSIFAVLMLVYGIMPGNLVWMYGVLLLIQLILVVGIGLILSACNLLYRDIQYVTNLLLLVWMYLTPVVYPLALVPEKYHWWYELNPMVGLVEGYRAVLFGQPLESGIIWWALSSSVVIFIVGYVMFKKLEKIFADVV